MNTQIIDRYIDLDQIARKEVNFKSKLIEWSQKNKYTVSFELIEQFLDHNSNPVFQTEVLIEGLSGGTGIGYSKKESQQNAAQIALKKIKKDPEFMENIKKNAESDALQSQIVPSTVNSLSTENEETATNN